MNDDFLKKPDSGGPNPEAPYVEPEATEPEFKTSEEALALAEKTFAEFKALSFSGRNAGLGKMVNCQVCGRRHRRTDVATREHYDEKGKLAKTIEPLISDCKQEFKQMWVDEDMETGELSIQYAIVPLPGQGKIIDGKTVFANMARPVVGAQQFAKKRKSPRPNQTGLEVVFYTRRIFAGIKPERFPEEAGRMLEARRHAINTVKNKRERKAKKIRQQQRESRRANRAH